MSNENEGGLFSCPVMCWIIGALLALATYLILSGRYEVSMVLALIIALGVFVVSGALLGRLFCRGVAASQTIASSAPNTVSKTASAGVAAAAVAGAATAASASKAKSAVAGVKPAAKPKAKAAAKPKAKSASAASTGAKKTAKPKTKPATKPKAKAAAKPAAKKPAAKTATKPVAKKAAAKTATKPARKPVAKDGKPAMLKKARASGADDLKQIKGVGPKMETMLNKMGVYHFDQVSGWRAQEVKWADENLEGFKGRVSRDEWVKQAKILAKGGKTEFSKKVAKGGVYAKNKK